MAISNSNNKNGRGDSAPVPFFEVRKLPGLLIFEKQVAPYQRDVIIKRLPFVHNERIGAKLYLQHNRKVLVQILTAFGLRKAGLNANNDSGYLTPLSK